MAFSCLDLKWSSLNYNIWHSISSFLYSRTFMTSQRKLCMVGTWSTILMVGLPDFRSHSKSRPFATQPLFEHTKSRLVRISDSHCSLTLVNLNSGVRISDRYSTHLLLASAEKFCLIKLFRKWRHHLQDLLHSFRCLFILFRVAKFETWFLK